MLLVFIVFLGIVAFVGVIVLSIVLAYSPGVDTLSLSSYVKGVYPPVRCVSELHVDLGSPVTETPKIDGVEVNPGDIILVPNQEEAFQNGFYTYEALGCAWKRTPQLCMDEQVVVGNHVYVEEGEEYSGVTLVLQAILPANQAKTKEFQGIRLHLQFVRLIDQVFGKVGREDGAMLVADETSPQGVEWTPSNTSTTSRTGSREIQRLQIAPQTSQLEVITLPTPTNPNLDHITLVCGLKHPGNEFYYWKHAHFLVTNQEQVGLLRIAKYAHKRTRDRQIDFFTMEGNTEWMKPPRVTGQGIQVQVQWENKDPEEPMDAMYWLE